MAASFSRPARAGSVCQKHLTSARIFIYFFLLELPSFYVEKDDGAWLLVYEKKNR